VTPSSSLVREGSLRLRASAAAIALCWLLLPASAFAQDTASTTSKPPHRFFDATNIALTAIEAAALIADGITTQHARTKYPEFFREADPIARPFVNNGWPGQIVGGAVFIGADVALRYWLHRKNHHRFERLVPLVLTTYGTVCAIHNAREIDRFERRASVTVTVVIVK
jgi:hypothetical protein